MPPQLPPFQRGDNYFYLTVEKQPQKGTVTTTIDHPAPRSRDGSAHCVSFEEDRTKETSLHSKTSINPSPPTPSGSSSDLDATGKSLSEQSYSDEGVTSEMKRAAFSKMKGVLTLEELTEYPLKVRVMPELHSPFEDPRETAAIYKNERQTWYYDRHKGVAPMAPPVAPTASKSSKRRLKIPFKALYICDVINTDDSFCGRFVWINDSQDEERPKWSPARDAKATQVIDGKEYGFYIAEDGPHWVTKKTLGSYKRRKY